MPNLNSKIVAAVPIKLPSAQRLADVVSALDALGKKAKYIQMRYLQTRNLKWQILADGFGE